MYYLFLCSIVTYILLHFVFHFSFKNHRNEKEKNTRRGQIQWLDWKYTLCRMADGTSNNWIILRISRRSYGEQLQSTQISVNYFTARKVAKGYKQKQLIKSYVFKPRSCNYYTLLRRNMEKKWKLEYRYCFYADLGILLLEGSSYWSKRYLQSPFAVPTWILYSVALCSLNVQGP